MPHPTHLKYIPALTDPGTAANQGLLALEKTKMVSMAVTFLTTGTHSSRSQ